MSNQPRALPRVCHIHLGPDHGGGAEVFFWRLVAALGRRGIPQCAVVMQGRVWIPTLKAAGCEVIEIPFRKGLLGFWANRQVAKKIKAWQPNAVMAWMNRAARRIPKGSWVTIGRLGGYYALRFYKKCQYLVGNTPDLIDFMAREGRDRTNLRMISNFTDWRKTAPLDRVVHGVPTGARLITTIGRLDPSKGFDVLLRALAQLDNTYLWIIGVGDERAVLETQARVLGLDGRVKFWGWVNGAAAHICAADVFVCPSRHEPLGNVLLDAWACEVPLVTTASEGPSWMVTPGVDALMVPIDNVNALATALRQVMDDKTLAEKLVEGGRKTLAERFSEDAVCSAYLELFNAR